MIKEIIQVVEELRLIDSSLASMNIIGIGSLGLWIALIQSTKDSLGKKILKRER